MKRREAVDQAVRLSSNSSLPQRLRRLERRLAGAANGAAKLSLVALPLTPMDRPALAYRPDEQFTAASTIKVYVLQALLERVAAGRLALADERELTPADAVTGSGVLKALSPARSYTLLDLATLMIVVSDNTATNMLIDTLGVDEINAVIAARGWRGTRLSGKLQQGPAQAGNKPSTSTTTAADLADYFVRVWRDELLPKELGEVARGIYRRQQLGELGRYLEHDRYASETGGSTLTIASKSGSVRGVRNDAGVVEISGPPGSGRSFVLAVMTSGCPDLRFHPENLGAKVLGAAAKTAFELMS